MNFDLVFPIFRADDRNSRFLRNVFSTFDFHTPLLPNKQADHHHLIIVKAQNHSFLIRKS